MSFIKSLVSKRHIYVIAIILLLSEIMPTYSRYMLKKLVYIVIIAFLGRQPSFYIKYTKSNIRSSCDIRSVSITKYAFFIYF